MMWLVFTELQKVVCEFYFRLLGEVNRNQQNIAARKLQISGKWPFHFKRKLSGENSWDIGVPIFHKN